MTPDIVTSPNESFSVAPQDDTGRRILAYLHSLSPLDSVPRRDLPGRELIERMAIESVGGDAIPPGDLSPAQVVDVLEFMTFTEPKALEEPEGEPSAQCGFILVVQSLIDSLRRSQSVVQTVRAAITSAELVRWSFEEGTPNRAEYERAILSLKDAMSLIEAIDKKGAGGTISDDAVISNEILSLAGDPQNASNVEPRPADSAGDLHERMEEERQRVFEVQSLVHLVQKELYGISGDEDAQDISETSAKWTNALEVAKRLLSDSADRIELMDRAMRDSAARRSAQP